MSSDFGDEKNPFYILKQWVKEAKENKSVLKPDAMLLSSFSLFTVRAISLRVSSRVVLLKEITANQLIFYTNYKSLKSQQITLLSGFKAALNFYWPVLAKQIRLEGIAQKISKNRSLQYWKSRPFESQVSQYISRQSSVLKSCNQLEQEWDQARKKFSDKKSAPYPKHWGGFAFTPRLIEFWIEKPHRLHKRIQFTKKWRPFSKREEWFSCLLYP